MKANHMKLSKWNGWTCASDSRHAPIYSRGWFHL